MSVQVNILSSGSSGNCTILNGRIAIDMGVAFRKIQPYADKLELVLLTHRHRDHFRREVFSRLSGRSAAIYGVPDYLIDEVYKIGVQPAQTREMSAGGEYRFDGFKVYPILLRHDVPNQGYKIHFDTGEKVFYATDTGSLEGIVAENYDLYLVEANYTEADLRRRIWEKEVEGKYCYEYMVRRNHLSKEACDAWLYSQMGSRSRYIYMHQHVDK